MGINITILGQLIAFGILVWFTMKFIWPPLIQAMAERENRISEGLQAAERGRQELDQAKQQADRLLQQARVEASSITAAAREREQKILEEVRHEAEQERARIVAQGEAELARQLAQAQAALRQDVVNLAVSCAERILQKEINAKAHQQLFDQVLAEVGRDGR
jgi:F-type H+-transporting ATPase subunit b